MNSESTSPKLCMALSPTKGNKQKGVTLIELLVVFVVIGILYGAVRYGYALTFGAKAQSDIKYMDYAMECARSTYGNASNYSTATIAALANNNCFPPTLVTNKGTATAYVSNKYGGLVTVAPSNVVGVNDGLDFTDPNIPSDVCVERLKLTTKPVKITVTPSGGSAVIVQAIGAANPDLTLSTSCGINTSATMVMTITKN